MKDTKTNQNECATCLQMTKYTKANLLQRTLRHSDESSTFPRTLLKTVPPLSGYPWVPGGREGPTGPIFMDHQVLNDLEF